MRGANGHALSAFDAALREVRDDVLKMASVAQENLKNSVRGLQSRNAELCNEAIAEDDEVNNFERAIDREGFEILIRFNPVAGDLREVLSAMKVANNLERVSDEAENIARHARKVLKQPEVPEVRLIEPLFNLAAEMVKDSVRAFSDGDIKLSISLKERDVQLDSAHRKTIKDLTKSIDKDAGRAKTYLHLIFIVRSLERIGDHAKNIGEDAVFLEAATDIRHLDSEAAAAEVSLSP